MNKTYSKIFKSNSELLPDIEDYILNIANQLNFSDTKRNNIELSVAEAAANSILHGNKNDISKNVNVDIIIGEDKMVIKFKDEGSGFNIDDIPDPTIPENILKGSGRGVHIMKTLVDKLEYNFNNSGTEVILTFNRENAIN